jgi:hypothetical protein
MTKNERLARIEQLDRRIWMLEMADFLRGQEREEWERLRAERNALLKEC